MVLYMRYYVPWLVSMAWLVSGKAGRGGHMKEAFGWSTVKFRYPTHAARDRDTERGNYKAASPLPLGLAVDGRRLFLTLPRWKAGVPATLATVPLGTGDRSPLLDPYPDWSWHSLSDCNGITSVFRVAVDECRRLWVLDSGKLDVAVAAKAVCPAQILVFDLNTDTLVRRYKIPKYQTPHNSLLINIAVDVRNGDCENAFAYSADVFRYGLVVYSLRQDRSWRVDHPYFFPDPLSSMFLVDGVEFSWTDGVFGLALSPVIAATGDRTLFFHPLSSFREFSVAASFLRNETSSARGDREYFKKVGKPRRRARGHASGSGMDRTGVLFYNLVSRNAVGCWNSNTGPHAPETQGVVAMDNKTLSFPNDLKLDFEADQGLWVLSNRLHRYLYSSLDPRDINFRVLTIKVKDAIRGTPCDPQYVPPKNKIKKQKNKCQEL